jgi:hypothetical protein
MTEINESQQQRVTCTGRDSRVRQRRKPLSAAQPACPPLLATRFRSHPAPPRPPRASPPQHHPAAPRPRRPASHRRNTYSCVIKTSLQCDLRIPLQAAGATPHSLSPPLRCPPPPSRGAGALRRRPPRPGLPASCLRARPSIPRMSRAERRTPAADFGRAPPSAVHFAERRQLAVPSHIPPIVNSSSSQLLLSCGRRV